MSAAATGTPTGTDVPRALRLATVAVAVIGAGMYGMAEAVRATGNPLALLGVVVLAGVPWLGRRHPLTLRGGTVISLGAILLAVLDWWLFTNDAALAVGRVVLALQMVRLWSPLGVRERLQVFLLSLTHLAAAAVLTIDILFAIFFVAYAVVATWALALQFLDQEARLCGAPPPRVSARFLAGISVLAVFTIAFTAGIFLVVPRVGAGLLQTDLTGNQVRVAGFSDSVRIGDIGEILTGAEEVMYVEFVDADDDPMNVIRMRGRVFERCRKQDNRYHWTIPTKPVAGEVEADRALAVASVGEETRRVSAREFAQMGTSPARYLAATTLAEPQLMVQRVTLKPMASPALFFAGPPRTVGWEQGWKQPPTQLRIDPGGTVVEWSLGARASGELKYLAEVWVDPVTRQGVPVPGPASLPPNPSRPNVRLDLSRCDERPDGMSPELWARLASHAAGWAGNATDPWQVAAEIERQLRDRGGYTYSLDMPDPGTADPLEYFLFTKKEGHCEYYAMSMVMLLRAAGHKARLVTGFVGGEINPVGGYRLILQSDAHAWVEVLSADGAWWKPFDPTPRAPASPGRMAIFGQIMDWVKFRWYTGVVDYDIHDQQRALMGGARTLGGWGESIKEWLRDGLAGTRGLRGAAGIAVIAIGLFLLARRKGAGRRSGAEGVPSIAFYAEFLGLLAAAGVARTPGQTPREFAARARVKSRVPAEPVQVLTDLFCRSRYGGARLGESEQSRAESALESIRAALAPAAQ